MRYLPILSIKFFKYIGGVVSVRLILNRQGKHLGYAFVEFVSPERANLALKNKNGEYLHDHEILLMKRLEDTPHFAETIFSEKVLCYKKMHQWKDLMKLQTMLSISFFKDVGEIASVRLIVDRWGISAGCCCVEFATVTEAKKVMRIYKHVKGIYVKMPEIASYPFRPKLIIVL
ncbi:unnamed protein product [Eruca vesicaria subsp. sativa]|uniref:RRM domain-containing protein n=1 Tax=Eruca vesicaria subsp. sativa TaxID=29727 RepID=A0ABC8IPW6_ERUVS|nr:unnamed protein product [Eruca vesicaria subsp. sativa]